MAQRPDTLDAVIGHKYHANPYNLPRIPIFASYKSTFLANIFARLQSGLDATQSLHVHSADTRNDENAVLVAQIAEKLRKQKGDKTLLHT